MINEFGEDTNSYCSFESKETALLHSENGNLQQRVNILTHEVRGEMRTRGETERGRAGDTGPGEGWIKRRGERMQSQDGTSRGKSVLYISL